MSILHNFPLIAAFISIFVAQFIKIPMHLITKRTLKIGLGFSTGGMPSSGIDQLKYLQARYSELSLVYF
ncbi:divergent PAP2 family protein [Paenibacillus sp. BR2-3]|uniref:divergent PAP2 family protein n=1 Tax=Paenibacillus sp. BR2-3 TaxID=3048494 RepID=UPI0039774565